MTSFLRPGHIYTNSICYVYVGYDGFQFTSVAAGTHFVTIRGTSNGQSDEATLGPLTSISELSFSVFVTVSGTIITVFIAANQAATFECQLDNQDFVPCK